MVRVEKKTPKKKGSTVSSQETLTVVQCWLVQGQEPDEEMQPILSYGQNSQLVYWWVLVHLSPWVNQHQHFYGLKISNFLG